MTFDIKSFSAFRIHRQGGQVTARFDRIGLADRHHIIEKGRVVWTGTSGALARDKELQHRYLGV